MALARRAVLVNSLLGQSSGCHVTYSSCQVTVLPFTVSCPGTYNGAILSPAQLLPCGYRSYTVSPSPSLGNTGPPLSPAVRNLVDSHRIKDLSSIVGTGPGNRLLKGYDPHCPVY